MAEPHVNGVAAEAIVPHGMTFIETNGSAFPDETLGTTFPVIPPASTYPDETLGTTFPVIPPPNTHPDETLGTTFPVIPPGDQTFDIPNAKLAEIKFTDYMKECLDKVASSEGFRNYDFKIDHGSAIGDGFVGLIFKAIIQEIDSEKNLTVLLKCPPENYARRHDFGALALFQREVYVYNEVLPEFVKFQESRKIKKTAGFFQFPKCYLADYNVEKDDAIIIMEDLRDSDYKMWNKFVPTNIEHTRLLVTHLGKLHAVSLAMKSQQPEMFEKFKAMDDYMSNSKMMDSFTTMLHNSIEQAANTLDESDTKRRARVLMLKEDVASLMRSMTDPKFAEPYAVVTHGDCWSNNFMYHYTRGRPEKIVFLDWQMSRYCSPVLDLVYFIFVCTDGPMRAKHYDELLNLYYRSLKDHLEQMGGDAMSQFPFTALLRQLKLFGKFGILMSFFLIPMMTTKNEDLPDMDFIAENMNLQEENPEMAAEMMQAFNNRAGDFKPRMRDGLLDAIRYGYL